MKQRGGPGPTGPLPWSPHTQNAARLLGRPPLGFPAHRLEGLRGGCILLFPEGKDRIWPRVLLAWLGAEGLPAARLEPAQPSVSVPVRAVSARLRVGDRPQGPPAVQLPMTLPQARPGQASLGLSRVLANSPVDSRERPSACRAGRGSQRKTKALQTQLASVLPGRYCEGDGPESCPPSHQAAPATYT